MTRWFATARDTAKRSVIAPEKSDGVGRGHPSLNQRLWKLTSLPRREFDLTYGVLLRRAQQHLANAPKEAWGPGDVTSAQRRVIRQLIGVLRVRQSRILPNHVATEDATRLAELMSFAIVVAIVCEAVAKGAGGVLLAAKGRTWCPLLEPAPRQAEVIARQPAPPGYGVLLIGVLLSEEGLRWLSQEPVVLNELLKFFRGDPNNCIAGLIDLAEHKAGRAPVAATPTIATPESVLASAQKKPAAKIANGWRYLHWLKAALEQQTLVINRADSVLHALNDGCAYLVVPDAFDAYATEQGLPSKRVQNQVTRLGLHRVKADGKNLYSGKLPDRRVKGLIFNQSDLFWSQPPPPSKVLSAKR